VEEPGVSLYQAVPKGKSMDLVVEKATEVGVGSIVPLISDHSIAQPRENANKMDRWRRIIESAARQSLRRHIPELEYPVNFSEAVEQSSTAGIILHNHGDISPLEEVAERSPVSLLVGPEGGWSEEELSLAGERGLSFAYLGPFRLRSETAGVVATARLRAALEGSRGKEIYS
jgi:16S rRNA (uracil1498-N3)-methyltransferase